MPTSFEELIFVWGTPQWAWNCARLLGLNYVYDSNILLEMGELVFQDCKGFEWDGHNEGKNRDRHGVEPGECEEAFFNRPFVLADDAKHSANESRFFALGKSDSGRSLLIVFTIRGDKVRVISARDMSRKERSVYEKAASRNT